MRKDKKTGKIKCRFNFPMELNDESSIINSNGVLKFQPKRNDERINCHNPFITSTWRANTDFQPIMSKQAVINRKICFKKVKVLLIYALSFNLIVISTNNYVIYI